MGDILKRRLREVIIIILVFFGMSLFFVQTITKTLWTAETNLRLDNNLISPLDFNTSGISTPSIVQGLYSNITKIDLNKEYLEMVALNPPFIDYVTSKYKDDERYGVFVDSKASKSGVNYVIIRAVADSEKEANFMLSRYLNILNEKVLIDMKNRSQNAQSLLSDLLKSKNSLEGKKLSSSEQDKYNQITAEINLIEWFNENYNRVIDIKAAINQYGKIKIYESAGSKFEKAIRVIAGTFAGLIVAFLYVVLRERKYLTAIKN